MLLTINYRNSNDIANCKSELASFKIPIALTIAKMRAEQVWSDLYADAVMESISHELTENSHPGIGAHQPGSVANTFMAGNCGSSCE